MIRSRENLSAWSTVFQNSASALPRFTYTRKPDAPSTVPRSARRIPQRSPRRAARVPTPLRARFTKLKPKSKKYLPQSNLSALQNGN
jgi:hypothetical protein